MKLSAKKPLYWAYGFCRILQVIVSFLFILFLIFLVYGLIEGESSGSILLIDSFKAGMSVGDFRFCENCNAEGVLITDLSNGMILWLMLRGSAIFILYLAIIRIIIKVLRSIKTEQTFYIENIKNFQFLTRYGGLLTFVGVFNFFSQDGISNFHFTIPFGAILFTLSCWVLTEIFREGKELSEDSKSIV